MNNDTLLTEYSTLVRNGNPLSGLQNGMIKSMRSEILNRMVETKKADPISPEMKRFGYDTYGYYEEIRYVSTKGAVSSISQCFHATPFPSLTTHDSKITTVELRVIKLHQELIGYMGKCDSCGKVHYRETRLEWIQ